jgi:hypothetical protein
MQKIRHDAKKVIHEPPRASRAKAIGGADGSLITNEKLIDEIEKGEPLAYGRKWNEGRWPTVITYAVYGPHLGSCHLVIRITQEDPIFDHRWCRRLQDDDAVRRLILDICRD